MIEGMIIRPFQVGEEDQVVAVWEACGLVVPQNDPYADIERKMREHPELFLVGERDGKLIVSVMAGYEGHLGWINYLAVHPDFRNSGLGKMIMEEAESLLKELGCPKINLQVRSTNQKVIDFYKRLGYHLEDIVNLGKRFTT